MFRAAPFAIASGARIWTATAFLLFASAALPACAQQVPTPQQMAPVPEQPHPGQPGVALGAAAKPARQLEKAQNSDDNDTPVLPSKTPNPVLWHDPGNISSLDLLAGAGGQKHAPAPPFSFVSEDKEGTNPKFVAKDANGHKWKVKLGTEARPEVVASRLLWAMGYFVNIDYVLPDASIDGIHLSRGGDMVKNGRVEDARFARRPKDEKKIGIWDWKQNPFYGKREWNGLRVMMAVMNNWDLKNVNNAVYEDDATQQQVYLVSDVGATFGANGMSFTKARSKGNIGTFQESKFITGETPATVTFATPAKPTGVLVESFGFSLPEFASRSSLGWLGKDIPRADARWIGSMLAQLSHAQLVDAFRAGQFPEDQIEPYVHIIETRITALQTL